MVRFSRRVQNLIANFRGLPRDDSSSILKEEQSIEQLIQDILRKYVYKSDVEIGVKIRENWPQIVGNMLCKSCTPHKIGEKGNLIIKVQSGVVRNELFLQKEEILQRIREICPRSGIRNVTFSL
jgi:predicted nucleic acid-binding Zn ribbon protein